jgi:hypothetical protein
MKPLARLIFTALAVALGWVHAPGAPQEKSSPNIVLLLADELGDGDAGCSIAEPKVPTSNLDRLAREGASNS